jgi:hypothetical protein
VPFCRHADVEVRAPVRAQQFIRDVRRERGRIQRRTHYDVDILGRDGAGRNEPAEGIGGCDAADHDELRMQRPRYCLRYVFEQSVRIKDVAHAPDRRSVKSCAAS